MESAPRANYCIEPCLHKAQGHVYGSANRWATTDAASKTLLTGKRTICPVSIIRKSGASSSSASQKGTPTSTTIIWCERDKRELHVDPARQSINLAYIFFSATVRWGGDLNYRFTQLVKYSPLVQRKPERF